MWIENATDLVERTKKKKLRLQRDICEGTRVSMDGQQLRITGRETPESIQQFGLTPQSSGNINLVQDVSK